MRFSAENLVKDNSLNQTSQFTVAWIYITYNLHKNITKIVQSQFIISVTQRQDVNHVWSYVREPPWSLMYKHPTWRNIFQGSIFHLIAGWWRFFLNHDFEISVSSSQRNLAQRQKAYGLEELNKGCDYELSLHERLGFPTKLSIQIRNSVKLTFS